MLLRYHHIVVLLRPHKNGKLPEITKQNFNPFKPNELAYSYLFGESISNFRCVGGIFLFYSNFDRTFYKQTVEILIKRRVSRRLIWVCTVCLCPSKRTLGLYVLIKHLAIGIVHVA